MLHLAFIFHMHQPYYKNLLTQETELPWVRLHGSKDYLDMVAMLEKFPAIHQTFNLVPSLLEQVEDFAQNRVKDKFLELSRVPAGQLTSQDKQFILQNFFSINKEMVIDTFPRYFELYSKKEKKSDFTTQDYLDLQVLFNLAWIDPYFRANIPELRSAVQKARFFTEEDKKAVLEKQVGILKDIIPGYKKFIDSGQVEVTVNPYYHPILPLLYDTNIAKEANLKTVLPKFRFAYPQDAQAQINEAVEFYKARFGVSPQGMWPSEESVSEHILPLITQAGINWIVTDEAILFKSLKSKKRNTELIYQPHLLKRQDGNLNIVFRDRNISDLIGFVYNTWAADAAVDNLVSHLNNINNAFKDKDILVTIAMDGENAWEYYKNDGHDFLELLYKKLSESTIIKTVTISEYLKKFPAVQEIKRLAAGSWIYGDFGKWIGNPYKVLAWEWLAKARKELEKSNKYLDEPKKALAWKQMHICEGSDWFWWYGGNPDGAFDKLYRMHLTNLYTIIGKDIPECLKSPLTPA